MSISKEQYAELTKEEIDEAYFQACENCDFELIKFLLTSKDIPINADIHYSNAVLNICMNNKLEILKYLLTSDDLTEKLNVHHSYDYLFRVAHTNQKNDVLEYLIFDFEIKETDLIKIYIGNNPKTINMFLNRDLNKELDFSTIKQKPPKI
jgi:hypothetical protein